MEHPTYCECDATCRRLTQLAGGNDWLKTGEIARFYRVDPKTVSRWAAAGVIPSIRTPGGQYRVRRADVHRAVQERLKP